MDDLSEQLATSFAVSHFPNSPHATHPRFSQYKQKNTVSQEERRRRLLELQKKRRYDFLKHVRKLTEGSGENHRAKKGTPTAENIGDDDSLEKPMDLSQSEYGDRIDYKSQVMESEWLVEVPEDLEENWYLVPCPVGKRNLIVTSKGRTLSFTKSGYMLHRFSSHLPGGNKDDVKGADGAILDCIFSECTRTYYVLDILCWNGHPVYDSKTDFRFYWKDEKLNEAPAARKSSSLSAYRFEMLPFYECVKADMERVMCSAFPFPEPLDGLLFYNKNATYVPGPTPLVGWLKPYMLPELLGVNVPETYMTERPSEYISISDHVLKNPVKKYKKKKRSKVNKAEKMET